MSAINKSASMVKTTDASPRFVEGCTAGFDAAAKQNAAVKQVHYKAEVLKTTKERRIGDHNDKNKTKQSGADDRDRGHCAAGSQKKKL